MTNPRETATILAALHFWREEMCPHDTSVMRPYFSDLELAHIDPLTSDEIIQLMRRLRVNVSNHGLGDSSTTSGLMDGWMIIPQQQMIHSYEMHSMPSVGPRSGRRCGQSVLQSP